MENLFKNIAIVALAASVLIFSACDSRVSCTITFNSRGGSYCHPITKNDNNSSIRLPSTSREGYIFNGWVTEYGFWAGNAGDMYNVNFSVVLYAQWREEGDDVIVNDIEYVFVEGGTFIMGCTNEQLGDCRSSESQTQVVTLSDFYISKYPITQAQYKSVMGYNLSYFRGSNNPVEQVNWSEAVEFCSKLGGGVRLPTEAEWEYAARGGNKSKGYKYSGSDNISEVAWYYWNSSQQTQAVGQKVPNELGIYDMSGNVWEWCSDWWSHSYDSSSQTNPTGPDRGSYRVMRGGSWKEDNTTECRISRRGWGYPSNRYNDFGFRVVFDAE